MAVITGGNVLIGGLTTPGTKSVMLYSEGVPATNGSNLGVASASLANGMLATDVLTRNVYERQAGLWVRIDTL